MPYDDEDDLFDHDFDFVDDDDDAEEASAENEDDSPKPKPAKKRPASRGRSKDKDKDKGEKGSTRAPKRGRTAPKREPRRESEGTPPPTKPPALPPTPAAPLEPAPVGYILSDELFDDEPSEVEAQPQPPQAVSGPPADHVVHIYEYGEFKRTIPRKFTDEEAVSFAEEYTRTGKAYGRYAIATPEDEQPSPTFAGAAKS
jgi:hypothetical protein